MIFKVVNWSPKIAAESKIVIISLNIPATENVTTEVSEIRKNSEISIRKARHPPNRIISMILSVEKNVEKNSELNILSRPSNETEAMKRDIAIKGDKNKLV